MDNSLYQAVNTLPVLLGAFLVSLLISLVFTPLVRNLAIEAGQYDLPGERKIHTIPTPRLGGLAIAAGFLVPILGVMLVNFDWLSGSNLTGIFLGAALMFFVGMVDDFYNLSPYIKLIGQILAILAAIALGIQIVALDLPFSKLLLMRSLVLPVTMVWLLGITNAMNFIDGVDGLAGGVTVIAAVSFAVVAYFMNEPGPALFALLLAGSCLGFLTFNFHPARIFMGDSGALLCGFVLAAIAVTGVFKTLTMFLLVPVFILTVPIVDITFATLRRLLQGKSPFAADGGHLHHRLLDAGFSQTSTVIALYAICILGGALSTIYINRFVEYVVVMLALAVFSAILILLRRVFYRRDAERIDLVTAGELDA
jgi:UDP-GlcNAc:undecaprenyl-phosphate/decaprenyl-phosphate GlcNAc-1-phosphate transferase